LGPVTATRRAWCTHALALAVVLAAVFFVVGHRQIADADEGAALLQAKVLSTTGHWSMPATSELDPTGDWYPIHNSNRVGDLAFPFTRPPLYPATIRPLLDAGGLGLVVAAHAAALWLAALGAGALAERLRPGRGIAALWLCGVLSPLLFDGYWAIAHTFAAAGAVWATYGATRVVVDRTARWTPVWLVGLGVACCYRNEALLFAAALAVALLAAGGARRWVRSIPLAAGTMAIAGGSWMAMNAYQRSAEGGSKAVLYHPELAGGFVSGRLKGFEHAVLAPGTGSALGVLLVLVTAASILGSLLVVRGDGSPRLARSLAVLGATAAVARLLLPIDLVTGLLMAAPFVVGAAVLLPSTLWRDPAVRLVAATAAVAFVAVTASMHEFGGGGEWGGRYYHVALPLGCVLAELTLDWLLTHRGVEARTVVLAGLVVSLALSGLSIRESRGIRDVSETLTETAWRTARTTRSARDPGGPVVVSTWVAGGRFSWRHILDGRYLTVDEPDEFPALGRRLAAAGVPDFTVLAEPADHTHLDEIGSGFHVTRTIPLGDHGWTVAVLSRS
jgi:hypothetical protein